MIILFKYCTDVKNCESFRGFGYFILFLYMYIYVCVDERVLGSKTLGSKCIRTTICNVLANYDQNIESRFRLLKVCLFVKLELSDCRIY